MKHAHLCLLSLLALSISAQGQNAPIDFEAGGFGADWTWTVFENASNPPLEIISNPDPSGANTSETVAQFTALDAGAPFAGCESGLATDLGVYTLSPENSFVTIMVWKNNISDVGIKLATTSLGALPELKIPNSLTGEWEAITFDFSGYIDNAIYAVEDVAQIVVFPDFADRDEDRVSYFDNITIGDGTATGLYESLEEPLFSISPNPVVDMMRIEAPSAISVVNIYGVTGTLIESIPADALDMQLDIDVSELATGHYMVEVISASGTSTRQLIKD